MSDDFKITLAEFNAELTAEWKKRTHYDFYEGSILDLKADAVVSPANSFGFMDGGIDLVYMSHFGKKVEKRVQDKIKREYGGELLVGQALVVETDDADIPYLICAPTMRVPMTIVDPVACMLAMRAAVRVSLTMGLNHILTPGLGTGTGRLKADWGVSMMLQGAEEALEPKDFPKSWKEAAERHTSGYVR